MVRWLGRALGLALACAAVGCGEGGVPGTAVSGKIVENGAAVKPPEKLPPGEKGLWLTFVRADAEAGKTPEQHSAAVKDDGSFTVTATNGKGIPAGKYKLRFEKGARGQTSQAAEIDGVEIPKAASAAVEVDVGKKTASVK